ncbi:hypothetical protein CEE45_09595 [Candidatus Heimdallarchaeota archaeon B3_Heim]|nr:MAG: hypothetical protein CEE45_09595 [Candidatus Heimdallarchaeota archaeon B3_Heim]
MTYCETCGKENTDNAKFCKSCGATLQPSGSGRQSAQYSPNKQSIGFGEQRTGENLVLRCTLCGSQDFVKYKGRLDFKWGFTSFKVVMMSCRHCGHIELFNRGRSIFDFD